MQNIDRNNAHPHFHPHLTGNALRVYMRGYGISIGQVMGDESQKLAACLFKRAHFSAIYGILFLYFVLGSENMKYRSEFIAKLVFLSNTLGKIAILCCIFIKL